LWFAESLDSNRVPGPNRRLESTMQRNKSSMKKHA
jgi:hypothetical protein